MSDTRDRLDNLRQARDEARSRLTQLGGSGTVVTFNTTTDWERLTLDEQRALIRATVKSAIVAPKGRGAERVTVELFRE